MFIQKPLNSNWRITMHIPNDYVRMAKHQCPVCGVTHEHNTEILIHKKLKAIKDDELLSGTSLCEIHDNLFKDGFIALIVIDEDGHESREHVKEDNATRTGELLHLKREVFNNIFEYNIHSKMPMVYITQEVYDMLVKMQA